jgi:diguanylate cyclase (GGDEF)-like protein
VQGRERSTGNWKRDATGVVLLIALLCLVLRLFGTGLFDGENEAVAVLVVAVAAGIAAWVFWRQDAERGNAEAQRARQEAEQARAAAKQTAREAAETREQLAAEQQARQEDAQRAQQAVAEEQQRAQQAVAEEQQRRQEELAEEQRKREEAVAGEERKREHAVGQEQQAREAAVAEQQREREQAVAAEQQAREEQARKAEEQLSRERREREQEQQQGADELQAERQQLEGVQHRLQLERRNAQELRKHVTELHKEFGGMAPDDDIRTLVLRVAMRLLEAKKGMLLSRVDADGDGKLDVVAVEGFERDVKDSRYAQRFAGEVVENDKIIREDTPEEEVTEAGGTADQEIQTLVAIPIYMADQFSGVILCANRDGGFENCDDQVMLALGDQAGAVLQNSQLTGQLRKSYVATVRLLADAIQAKDPFLRGHSEEVAEYVSAVARSLDIEPRLREQLNFASLLHDVGKIGISERILLKPGQLTPEERSIIELHPRIGFRLVEQVPGMDDIAPAILHHHEWFDGSGYPSHLRGEAIPIEARIICVADSFSAMTEQRPYKDRMSLDDACTELQRCAGTQFDPAVVQAFVEAVNCSPQHQEPTLVGSALSDSELEARRAEGEPILGAATAALTDSLTLLYSHRYFHETAQSEADRAALQQIPFTIVTVELKGLEEINRRAGYAAGDETLREAARALSRVAVRYGAIACRTGGRRLGLVVTGMDDAAAQRLADEVTEDVARDLAAQVAFATWRPGEAGDDVISRARTGVQPVAGSTAPA